MKCDIVKCTLCTTRTIKRATDKITKQLKVEAPGMLKVYFKWRRLREIW